jgi:hypothetical protein
VISGKESRVVTVVHQFIESAGSERGSGFRTPIAPRLEHLVGDDLHPVRVDNFADRRHESSSPDRVKYPLRPVRGVRLRRPSVFGNEVGWPFDIQEHDEIQRAGD